MNISTNPSQLLIIALFFALLPLVIGALTCYVKVSIVIGSIKSGLGATSIPGGIGEGALCLALTLTIMQPVISSTIPLLSQAYTEVSKADTADAWTSAVTKAAAPWFTFIDKNTDPNQREQLKTLLEREAHETSAGPFLILSYILSELKKGFFMALLVLVPFLVVDLVVGVILSGIGLSSLSPALISLPIKLALFVGTDAWLLLTKELVSSYTV